MLSTAVDVQAGHAYTVAGMGPAKGLRLQIIPDRLTTPAGKSLVRVIQASLDQNSVSVTAGGSKLASSLKFASVTGYKTVSPGTVTVHAAGSSESATSTITLGAGTIHTLVILDDPASSRSTTCWRQRAARPRPAACRPASAGRPDSPAPRCCRGSRSDSAAWSPPERASRC